MGYHVYRPTVAEHLVYLSFAALPLVPFGYGLKSGALRWGKAT